MSFIAFFLATQHDPQALKKYKNVDRSLTLLDVVFSAITLSLGLAALKYTSMSAAAYAFIGSGGLVVGVWTLGLVGGSIQSTSRWLEARKKEAPATMTD